MSEVDSAQTQDLVITRTFEAPVEQVWKAWSDPELVMQWWGPDGFTAPSAEMEFREGGRSLLCMRAPEAFGGRDYHSTWVYTKIIPMELIEYVHTLADKGGHKVDPASVGMPGDFPQDQRYFLSFLALGDGRTELTVTEYGWPVGHMMEMSRMGMEQCLEKMAKTLQRLG